MRLLPRFFALAIGFALLSVLTASSALADETKTKTFVGQKICRVPFVTVPPTPGRSDGYCLITKASLGVLLNAKAYYTDPVIVNGVMNSPITIRANDRRHSTATGHCTYTAQTANTPGHGHCEYWAGTGRLAGFHARFVIGAPTPTGVSVIGPYWFDRDRDNNDDENGDD
jgi:hypothetical protein